MKPSPIQVKPISFRYVRVEFDGSRLSDDGSVPDAVALDFDNVVIGTDVGIAKQGAPDAGGTHFFLTLRVHVDNDSARSDHDTRFSPYLIDVEAGAEVVARRGSEKIDDVEDLVLVNGTSLLWSAIREQVSTLTARMPAGMVQLPTVHFLDLKEQRHNRKATAKSSDKATKKAPRKAAKKAVSTRKADPRRKRSKSTTD